MARRKLWTLELSGPRRYVRAAVFWVLAIVTAVSALGYVLPAHRLRDELEFHSNLADGGIVPLLALGAAAILTFVLRTRRFGAGFAAGISTFVCAALAIMSVFLAHFLSRVEYGIGEWMFAFSALGTVAVSVVLLVVEVMVFVLERRARERAEAPAALPTARVLE